MGRVRLDALQRVPRRGAHRVRARRPRRLRPRPGRRRHLPAGLPGRLRDARAHDLARRDVPRRTDDDPAPTAGATTPPTRRAAEAPATIELLQHAHADLNVVRDGFARFDVLDKRIRFLVGPYADTLDPPPIDSIALLVIGREAATHADEILDRLYDRIALGGSCSSTASTTASARRRDVPRRRGIERGRRAHRRVGRHVAQDRAPARAPGSTTTVTVDHVRQGPPLAPPAADRRQGPVGGGRLLQHEARGGAHAALAVARVPARRRRPRLRGHRRRERIGSRPGARRRSSCAASGRSSATSTWARTPRRRRSGPQPGRGRCRGVGPSP